MGRKVGPITDIDTIYFKYFEAGHDPNKPNEPRQVVFEPSKIWGKFHGEWYELEAKNMRTIVGDVKRLLAKQ